MVRPSHSEDEYDASPFVPAALRAPDGATRQRIRDAIAETLALANG